MKQALIIVSFYVIALAGSLTYIYTIGQQYVEPEIEEGLGIIITSLDYKGNPAAISFCRKTEFLVKLYELRDKAFRTKVFEGLDMSAQIQKFDDQIDNVHEKLQRDIERLKEDGLEPPTAHDCDYIW